MEKRTAIKRSLSRFASEHCRVFIYKYQRREQIAYHKNKDKAPSYGKALWLTVS
jgi:hypothetical protein